MSYQTISASGGGINSTVRATRDSSEAELLALAQPRLERLLREGVTTLEIKSGYGLDLPNERKMLRVARQLADHNGVELSATLLSAHATPPEYQGDADGYITLVCETILPTLWQEGLFESVDVFCEKVGFSPQQTERVFQAAQALGIPVKGHVEQLSSLGGAQLVSRYHGLSADHIEYLTEEGVAAMRESGTVAALLPGAFYFLNETRKPPVELLRKYQVPMAVATDFNPGTSPFASLHLAMNMACVKFGLTPEEAWAGVTRHAARRWGASQPRPAAPALSLTSPSGMLSIPSRWCMSRGAVRSGIALFKENCNDAVASYASQSLAGTRRQRGSAQCAAPVPDHRPRGTLRAAGDARRYRAARLRL